MNFAGQSVAFVAGAPTIIGRNLGDEIDSHDIVMRSNLWPYGTPIDHGSRCDVLTCVRHHADHAPSDVEVWTYRNHPKSNRVIQPLHRRTIADHYRYQYGVNLGWPTTGVLMMHIALTEGARSFKYYGITGYQNRDGDIVNDQHYTDEWMDNVGGREYYQRTDYTTFSYHNFEEHNTLIRHLFKLNAIQIDQFSAEYFR